MTATVIASGCSTSYHREKADATAYGIIEDAEWDVFGGPTGFSIDTRFSNRLPGQIDGAEIIDERLGERRLELSLSDALSLAVDNSREYQTRKENLYLAALELSRQRHEFRPRFFGGADVSAERTPDGERRGNVSGQAGLNQVLQTGARIGVTVTNDLLQYLTGDPRRTATTAISLNFVQPLLRGAGADIVAENLTQAERNVIYEIRSFSHYQQTFAVRIASSYYRILQQKDAVRNEYNSYRNLSIARERAEALARDRLPEFQADQARQDELRARNRYILAVESYLNSLDQFKLELGLPLGYHLVLDEQPLRDLEAAGLLAVPYLEEEAIGIAISSRLDLLNEIDRFEDAYRQIGVAANQLKANLDLFGNVSLASSPPADYTTFDLNNYRASVGLGLNLPLDRLRERNLYRSSLINYERQIRALSLALDQVRNDIRQSLRTLDQAHQTFQIQQRAVQVADRRLEAANLLLEAGRAEMRDLLEAEAAQLQARNALTQALIDYHVARYQFLRNMGILETDEEGLWIRDILQEPDPASVRPRTGLDAADVITPDELFSR
jgi:outer membrane protein TolC